MNIEERLKELNGEFSPYFHTRVLAKLNESKQVKGIFLRRVIAPSLAMLAILICVLYVQEGTLSIDSVLGVSDFDSQLNDYIMYY